MYMLDGKKFKTMALAIKYAKKKKMDRICLVKV